MISAAQAGRGGVAAEGSGAQSRPSASPTSAVGIGTRTTDVTTGSDELLRIYGLDPTTQQMPDFKEQRGRCYPVDDWERVNAAVQWAVKTGHRLRTRRAGDPRRRRDMDHYPRRRRLGCRGPDRGSARHGPGHHRAQTGRRRRPAGQGGVGTDLQHRPGLRGHPRRSAPASFARTAPMAERLGVTPEQCVGLRCYEAVHGTTQPPDFCPHAQTCRDGREHTAEVHEPRLGGHFLVSTTPRFDEQGRLDRLGACRPRHHQTQTRRRGTRDRGGIPAPGE